MMKKKIMTLICFILSNNCIQAMQTDEMSEIGGLQNRKDPYFSAGAFENEENKPQQTEKNKESKKNKIKKKRDFEKAINIDYQSIGNFFSNFSYRAAMQNKNSAQRFQTESEEEDMDKSRKNFNPKKGENLKSKRHMPASQDYANREKFMRQNAEKIISGADNPADEIRKLIQNMHDGKKSKLYSRSKTGILDIYILYDIAKERKKISSEDVTLLVEQAAKLKMPTVIIFLTEQNKDLQIPPDVLQKILDQLDAKNEFKEPLGKRDIKFCKSIFNAKNMINPHLMRSLMVKEEKRYIPFDTAQLVTCVITFYLVTYKILCLENGVKIPFDEATKRIIAEKMKDPQIEQALRITLFIQGFDAVTKVSKHNAAPLIIFKLFYKFFSPYKYETAHLVIDQFLEENAATYPELYKFWQENQTAISEIEKKGYFALFDIFPWYSKDPTFAEMRESSCVGKKIENEERANADESCMPYKKRPRIRLNYNDAQVTQKPNSVVSRIYAGDAN